MKKLTNLIAFLVAFSAFTQKIPQGTRFIGSDINVGFQQLKVDNLSTNNIFSLGLSPSFTKFKKDNFSVTNLIGYGIERRSNIPFYIQARLPNNTTQHSFILGKYYKNYKMLTDKLGISAQYGGSIGFSLSSFRQKSAFVPISEQKRSIGQGIALNIGAGASIIYLLNEKFAIEGSTNLLNLNISYDKGNNSSAFSVSTGLSGSSFLGLGIRYFRK